MRTYSIIAILLVMAILVVAQQPVVKTTTAPQTSAASGKDMYVSYCASCHGRDAKGNGPAAPAMKSGVPDLTTLAKRHAGKYPELRVQQVIRGDAQLPAHGSKEMPVWGPVLNSLSQKDQALTQLRIVNLSDYIGTLQAK
jgi:mono/diheme cytochrome c family protein